MTQSLARLKLVIDDVLGEGSRSAKVLASLPTPVDDGPSVLLTVQPVVWRDIEIQQSALIILGLDHSFIEGRNLGDMMTDSLCRDGASLQPPSASCSMFREHVSCPREE